MWRWQQQEGWPRGVMVSTQDSESCDPSSNLGRTCLSLFDDNDSPVQRMLLREKRKKIFFILIVNLYK